MKSPVDWRKHPRQFRCRCERCVNRLWQARYGESNQDFRKRYLERHTSKL